MPIISCAESSGEQAGQAAEQYNYGPEKVDEPKGTASQESLINKANKAKDAIVEAGRAYSKPLLLLAVTGGAVIFIIGVLIGIVHKKSSDVTKGTGLGLIISAVIGYLLINNAPVISDRIYSFAQWFFS
ncbi:hypothetical protein DCCM_4596 [Desulfocucumis palustris]|uniref:Uncharacterized protein n=1 Tax=Desulfocucumis palustris TaxID=1898651 RepID=A0A2L2XGI1_9FIRM|nr:hypothetical protein [Desulfocucumis palustris]GBF35467.1 hypothetical protein DCCM_4596 [Desulfocucumis palustris]